MHTAAEYALNSQPHLRCYGSVHQCQITGEGEGYQHTTPRESDVSACARTLRTIKCAGTDTEVC